MLATASDLLPAAQIADLAVMIFGAGLGAGYLLWLRRRGELGNPLAGMTALAGTIGPRAGELVLVVLLYLILTSFLGSLVLRMEPGGAALEPGSNAWHLVQTADAASRLIVCLLMVLILRAAGSASRPDRPALAVRLVAGPLLAALAVLPICAVQLKAGIVTWQWLHPGQSLPVHPVLQAARHSAWGSWGNIQLLLFSLIVAPLAEELFFRGLLLQAVWRWLRRAWPAVIISAVAFGFVHGQPQDIVPLCTLGLVLGYLRLRSGSLAACVVCHALFNARTMILVLFFPELLE
jgi:membrane protease YdiL (CAAX protease family)